MTWERIKSRSAPVKSGIPTSNDVLAQLSPLLLSLAKSEDSGYGTKVCKGTPKCESVSKASEQQAGKKRKTCCKRPAYKLQRLNG